MWVLRHIDYRQQTSQPYLANRPTPGLGDYWGRGYQPRITATAKLNQAGSASIGAVNTDQRAPASRTIFTRPHRLGAGVRRISTPPGLGANAARSLNFPYVA